MTNLEAKAREIAGRLDGPVSDHDLAVILHGLRSARNEALEEAAAVAGPREKEAWSYDMMLASHIIRGRIDAIKYKTETHDDPQT
jgi:hypothetical protein